MGSQNLETLNCSQQKLATFTQEMEECSIILLNEIPNLSTIKVSSIYYTLCIIHYTTKK